MNRPLILCSSQHPLHHKLVGLGLDVFDMEHSDPFEDRFTHFVNHDVVFDFSLSSVEKKIALLKQLSKEKNIRIVSELSCFWGEELAKKFPKLRGGVALACYSPKNCYEYYCADSDLKRGIESLFQQLNFRPLEVRGPGLCFTYPRVISMIINEAYFALGEKLALPSDIDQAMLYGVNYPLGPLQWSEKIGPKIIVKILNQLSEATQDPRYQIAPLLKLQAS